MPDRLRIAAHAKINLFLRVLSRGADGFHGIETLFALLELSDEITVERRDRGVELTVDGYDTGPVESNLAYRAATAVLEATGVTFGVAVRIRKRIPPRSGLGGGSSDGAATLHAVNHLAGNAVPRHELLQFAARLGSDVTFFASGVPMALGWNRGERLFQINPPPATSVLVGIPHDTTVDTALAYRLLDERQPFPQDRATVLLDTDAFETWGGIGRLGGNDFESAVFARHPNVRALFEQLASTGPLAVRMSGSGSAVVALYRTEAEMRDAALTVGSRDHTLIQTKTRSDAAPAPEARSD